MLSLFVILSSFTHTLLHLNSDLADWTLQRMLNTGHIRIYHVSHNPLEVVENEVTSVKGVAVCEGSQVSPAYKSNMKIKVSMEHWWNDINRGKPKCSEKTLSQCNLFRHESHMDFARIECGVPR
jgi:hypothetical protein